ncbi:hypothetical protein [uncultured Cohaesibacter sp.]|nr:hypothetical protein [uncultured Cohaesibacter sp.]
MNFFNRAFEKVIAVREEQAQRFVDEMIAERGLDVMVDMSNDLRG